MILRFRSKLLLQSYCLYRALSSSKDEFKSVFQSPPVDNQGTDLEDLLGKLNSKASTADHSSIQNFQDLTSRRELKSAASQILTEEVVDILSALARVKKDGDPDVKRMTNEVLFSLSFQLKSIFSKRAFTAIQFPQIVYALGVLQYQNHHLMKQIISIAQDSSFLADLSSIDLACLMYGLGQLSLLDVYLTEKLVKVIREKGLESFGNRELSALLYTLMKLNWKQCSFVLEVSKEACHWMRLQKYDSWTLSSVCYSLGHLPASSRPDLKHLFQHLHKEKTIADLDTQGLVHIVHGMHLMKVKDVKLWKKLSKEVDQPRRLKKFTEQGLATLFFSLSSVLTSKNEMKALFKEITKPERLHSFKDRSLMSLFLGLKSCSFLNFPVFIKLLEEVIKPSRLESLSLRNLTAIVLCIRHFRLKEKSLVAPVFLEIFNSSKNRGLDAQIISLTIYSLGKLKEGLVSYSSLLTFLEKVQDPGILSKFTPQGLACLIYGLGELNVAPRKPSVHCLVDQVLRMGLDKFNNFELLNVLFGLGKCGFNTSSKVGVMFHHVLQKERLLKMDCQNLVTLMLAMKLHQLSDQEAQQLVMERIIDSSILPFFAPLDISKIVYSLSSLRYPHHNDVEVLVERMLAHGEAANHYLSQLLTFLAEIGYANNTKWTQILKQMTHKEIKKMDLEGLSNMIYSLGKMKIEDHYLKTQILKKLLMRSNLLRVKSIGLIKVLEGLVELDVDHKLDKEKISILNQLLKNKRRFEELTKFDLLRIVDCLHRTQLLNRPRLDIKMLASLLSFQDGLLFTWMTNHQLLFFISTLKDLLHVSRNLLDVPKLVSVLENELFRLSRRDGIEMLAMEKARLVLNQLKS